MNKRYLNWEAVYEISQDARDRQLAEYLLLADPRRTDETFSKILAAFPECFCNTPLEPHRFSKMLLDFHRNIFVASAGTEGPFAFFSDDEYRIPLAVLLLPKQYDSKRWGEVWEWCRQMDEPVNKPSSPEDDAIRIFRFNEHNHWIPPSLLVLRVYDGKYWAVPRDAIHLDAISGRDVRETRYPDVNECHILEPISDASITKWLQRRGEEDFTNSKELRERYVEIKLEERGEWPLRPKQPQLV